MLIANPASGSYSQHVRQVEESMTFLREQGWQVELCLTREAGDARRLAREAARRKVDVVVAVGGDGTINEIIQELAGSETALGVLPSGTVNVWAREVGIPLENAGAEDVLVNGQTRLVDLGKVSRRDGGEERYFLLMVGVGFDGEVTHTVEKKAAKRLGVLGYLLVGTWLGLGYRAFRATLAIGNKWLKSNALQIIIGNTQLYGGALKYTWRARCDDGQLDICVVRKQSMLGRIMILADFLLRNKQRGRWIYYKRATSVTLYTRRAVAIQIDGDAAGYTSPGDATVFSIVPGTLRVIVPKKTPEGLFSSLEE
jgi:YegS/Rv2252/BmrU family lipid kinase